MFFFHSYLPDLWEGYIKNNLIRKNAGVKFCQGIEIDEKMKFNNLAKKDGKLYKLLKENKFPFYIDRLQGGCYIENYPYDMELVEEYKNMLGDKFFGFHMHEWMSNYCHEIHIKLNEIPKDKWSEENIKKTIFEKFPGKYLFLESMTLSEMAAAGKPETFEEFYNNITAIYKKRLEKMDRIIPCDSSALAYAFELSLDAKRVCTEVGGQTPHARVQICYARGMTQKMGKGFGVYYEPWRGSNVCTFCGNMNEWGIDENSDFPFRPYGPNGGTSRSLQKRIYLYAYLSNAEYIAEEWGGYNTFNNIENFELSSYGIVKKEFIDFCDKYCDVGEKIVPMAAVLPEDMTVLPLTDDENKLLGYECKCEKINNARRKLFDIFTSCAKAHYERPIFGNFVYPDGIDILNRNDDILCKYDYLIDLTGDEDFKEKHNNVIKAEDVKEKLNEVLPCSVEGDIHWMVNKCKSGGFYLTVFNHSGVERSIEEGEKIVLESMAEVYVTFKNGAVPTLLEGDAYLKYDGNKYRLTVKGGNFAFIKF